MTKYYTLARVLIEDALQEQVGHYGIEGLEDAIKRNYKLNPVAQEKILEVYYEMYKEGKFLLRNEDKNK